MTADAPTLLALAAEVEALTGPSREADARVWSALHPNIEPPGGPWVGAKGKQRWLAPELTASVDRCLALLASELPGYVATISTYGFASKMPLADVYREGHVGRETAKAATLPLALLAAILRAKTQEAP